DLVPDEVPLAPLRDERQPARKDLAGNDCEVETDRLAQEQAFTLAVQGNEADAAPLGTSRRSFPVEPAKQLHAAARRLLQPEDDAQDLFLPLSGEAGKPEDLASLHLEADLGEV